MTTEEFISKDRTNKLANIVKLSFIVGYRLNVTKGWNFRYFRPCKNKEDFYSSTPLIDIKDIMKYEESLCGLYSKNGNFVSAEQAVEDFFKNHQLEADKLKDEFEKEINKYKVIERCNMFPEYKGLAKLLSGESDSEAVATA